MRRHELACRGDRDTSDSVLALLGTTQTVCSEMGLMRYTPTLPEGRSFIAVTIAGVITGDAAIEMNFKVHGIGRELGINRYLADVTQAENRDSGLGNYDFAYRGMRGTEGIDRCAVTAVVIRPGDHSHDFVETVAINAGLCFRLFTDPDQARQFLAGNCGT